jgi:tetratricopeptide (TPR) repeat protein
MGLGRVGDFKGAEGAFREAIQRDPTAGHRFNLAFLLETRGDKQEAARLYAEILREDPTFQPALKALNRLSTSSH